MSSEDFKSFCRALIPSEVGSIPTRSRHLSSPSIALFALVVALGPARALAPDAEEPAEASEAAELSAATEPFRPSPGGAFRRSALVPGWGQLYNRRPIKAVLLAAGRVYLASRVVTEHRLAADLEDEALALASGAARDRKWRERNRALDRRDDFIWYSAFALLFTMVEAYVDAALMEFDEEMGEIEGSAFAPVRHVRVGFALGF